MPLFNSCIIRCLPWRVSYQYSLLNQWMIHWRSNFKKRIDQNVMYEIFFWVWFIRIFSQTTVFIKHIRKYLMMYTLELYLFPKPIIENIEIISKMTYLTSNIYYPCKMFIPYELRTLQLYWKSFCRGHYYRQLFEIYSMKNLTLPTPYCLHLSSVYNRSNWEHRKF